jgi:hypothetical protein
VKTRYDKKYNAFWVFSPLFILLSCGRGIFFQEDSMNRRSRGKGIFVLFLVALVVLLGCPTGSSTDPNNLPPSDDKGGGGDTVGGGGDNLSPDGDPTNVDQPASGYMSSTTAGKVFGFTTSGDSVTITGFKSTVELKEYLKTGTSAKSLLPVGPLFAVVSGGTQTFTIAKIGGKDVTAIAPSAFSPVANGAAYDSTKDITLVVGKIVLPATITTLGKDLFVGVKAAVEVDIPEAVVTNILANAGEGTTEARVLAAIIGETEAVTVVEGTSPTPVIKGAPVLLSVGPAAINDTTLTVPFGFNEAVVAGTISVTGSLTTTGTLASGSGTKNLSITVASVPASGAVVISFTATASSGSKTTEVSETVSYGTAASPTTSNVAVKSADTTTGLSIASATKTGDTHLITLSGTGVPKTIPSNLTDDFVGMTNVAVITFTGIFDEKEAARIQQTNPALEQYITGANTAHADGTNYQGTPKTQTEIDTAISSAPTTVYFWKTATPVTYNRIRNYTANPDGTDTDFSILLQPTVSASDQKVTIIKTVGTTTTTFIIDYTGVIFADDVKGTVKVSTNKTDAAPWAFTTSGLTVASAIQVEDDVYITLAGTNVPKTINADFLAANYAGVTGCAVISLDGIFIGGSETFRYQGANPALQQYVTGSLNGGGQNYGADAKTQAQIETAFTANSSQAYFWQTANPVTYNKMVQVTGGTDTVLSILLTPTVSASDQKVTIIKKVGTPGSYTSTITYHLDYSDVTFAQ